MTEAEVATPDVRVRQPDARLIGVGAGIVSFFISLIGIGTTFNYDEAWAVGIARSISSPFADFGSQSAYANQPLYAVLEWLQIHLTGNTSEVALRLLSVVALAAAVGILTTAVAARWGTVPALFAGATVATSPLLFAVARQARGYGLAALFVVTCSVVLVDHLDDPSPPTRWRVGYTLLAIGALSANVYLVVLLIVHAAVVAAHGRTAVRRWVVPIGAAVLVGLLANTTVISSNLSSDGQGRRFRPRWPAQLAWGVTGSQIALFLLATVIIVTALWLVRRNRPVWAAIAAAGAGVTLIWLAGPVVLWAKYFLWMVPVLALAVAVTVRRYRAFMVVAALLISGQLFVSVRATVREPRATREAASIVDRVTRAGGTVCVSYRTKAPLLGYTDAPTRAVDPDAPSARELEACDVLVTIDGSNEEELRAVAGPAFPRVDKLSAATPGWLYYRPSTECVYTDPAPMCWS